MAAPLIFVTGFEPFLDVDVNPSGELARALVADPPAGMEISGGVLPVSIERVPAAFDELFRALRRAPAALVALGVQRKSYFRLERFARAALTSHKIDNDGRRALGTVLAGPPRLATELPLENLADALREAGAEDVRISEDAGGYVCERTYYLVLQRAKDAGVPGLFLHVPPVASAGVSAQRPIVEALLRAVVLAL